MADTSTNEKLLLKSVCRNSGLAKKLSDVIDAADVLSSTEVGFIDGVTAGTAAANKALVLNGALGITTIASATITALTSTSIASGTIGLTGKVSLAPLGSAAASASGLLMGVGTSAAPALSAVADAKFVEIRAKTTATSGDERLGYFRFDIGGAGAGGETVRALTDLTAAASTAHGVHASLQAGATGYVTGLGVGVRSQLFVKNEAVHANGTYYAGMSEVWSDGSSSSVAAATAHAIHSFQATGNATGKATVLNVWDVQATAAADATKAISSVSLAELPTGTVGIAVTINGTRYYVPAVVATEWN